MSVPAITDELERPTLQVRYETKFPIGAADFGDLIRELGKGFERFARGRRLRNVRLVVVRAGLGSHWIDLAVIGASTAVSVAVTYRKEIYDFADFLGKVFDVAKGLRRESVKVADKKLIDSINAPVANGQAIQVNVMVSGGAPVITINQQSANSLWIAEAEDRAEANLVRSGPLGAPSDRTVRAATPALRHLKGHFGTILDVKGRWYVRLEGEQGVLNPVSLAPGVHVVDDQPYLIDGNWEGRRYAIHKAEPIGPGGSRPPT